MNVSSSLYYVYNDPYVGVETARAVAEYVRAEDVKFIEGHALSHADAGTAKDARCYTIDDIMVKFSAKEAERGDVRKEYRRKAAASAKQLPFEDGCIGIRE